MNLSGKVVLLTGASQGIGMAAARLLRARGARLSLTSLPGQGLPVQAAGGELATEGDLTDGAFRQRLYDATMRHFGRVDVLVNNAGVGLYAPPSTAEISLSCQVFDLNVFAALGLAQLVIPDMRRRQMGTIVNIGSVGGRVSLPWAVIYCSSKFALHAVSDSLRRELSRDGIHVMKVCPGIVDTGFRDHVLGGSAPGPVSEIRRVVSPERVAAAMIQGIERGSRTVYVPALAWAFMHLEEISSRLMDWYIRKQW